VADPAEGVPVETENSKLRYLLREQLTAVHQQFVHIIALREWGDEEFAASIEKVDNADFPVAMKVMDHLISGGSSLDLSYQPFAPGSTVRNVLAAERAVERSMRAALSLDLGADHPAGGWIAAARAPRQQYADWLDERELALGEETPTNCADTDALGGMFAHLIAMIEQAMAHAFVHWHWGTRHDADAAWETSGTAMMKAAALVRATAARRGIPIPANDARITIQNDPEAAHEADRFLASSCARSAHEAAKDTDGDIAALCRDVEAYAQRLVAYRSDGALPPINGSSKAFRSFETTLTKYVR
jgi:bacterioferritin (cytochrome b1)